MKILFVNEKHGFFGGVEQNIYDSASGLTRLGHECQIAWFESTQNGLDDFNAVFCGSHQLAARTGFPVSQEIERLYGDVQPDVVYLHKVPEISPFLTSTSIRKARMIHDHDLCCPRKHKYYFWNHQICHSPMGLKCYIDLAFIRKSADSPLGIAFESISKRRQELDRHKQLDLIVVASHYMRDELRVNGFQAADIRIIPPVIRFSEEAPAIYRRSRKILYVGQTIRGKGVDLLLRALSLMETPYSADIIGAGNALDGLKQLSSSLGLEGKVRFHGWVAHRDLSQFYAGADLVAVPSRWPEPFGMIGLEAMSHGRPVVAFASGGIPDWLEHEKNGLLAPAQDIRAFARAMEYLLQHPDRAEQMGHNGREMLMSRFYYEGYIGNLEKALMGG